MNLQKILKSIDKLINVIDEPVKVVCNWSSEPLRAMQDKRTAKLEKERKEQDFDLAKRTKEVDVRLHLERKTGVARIIAEIEQLRKDKEFERFKSASEALIAYRERLTQLNIDAFSSIGHMQIDLYERAQNLILEKTNQYKAIQAAAMQEAKEDVRHIVAEFSDNDRAMSILLSGVDSKLSGIIGHANKFIDDLSIDMKRLGNQISSSTDRAQNSIEAHTQRQLEYLTSPVAVSEVIEAEIEPQGNN